MSGDPKAGISLVDDRGCRVSVVFDAWAAGTTDPFAKARSALRMTTGAGLSRMLLLLGWLLGLMLLWSFWTAPTGKRTIGRAIGLASVIVLGVLFWYFWYKRRRSVFERRLVERGKAARACPACGYGLGECVAAEDGRTVCPECGGAWNLDVQGESKAG